MPDNTLEKFAPCSEGGLSTYWPTIQSVDPRWSDLSPEPHLSIPVNFGPSSPLSPVPPSGVIGSVLPLRRAEELISTLPGVLSVRIVPGDTGSVGEIHVLTTNEVAPKNMVRNIESALMAQLGLRIDHRKVSIAQSLDPIRAADRPVTPVAAPSTMPSTPAGAIPGVASPDYVSAQAAAAAQAAAHAAAQAAAPQAAHAAPAYATAGSATVAAPSADTLIGGRRKLIFEDVEVRRSRTRGVLCRVTLSKDGQEYFGDAEGQESERSRVELAARAAVFAILEAVKATPGGDRSLALEGSKLIDAFDREFIFVSLIARIGRETAVLTGSCEVRESKETSAVLAVLDATNRWMHLDR
jgi:hypothetical protein